MYTTTHCKVFPGPVETFWVITGVACCLAQVGSLDMSIGFILAGVPVYVTFPVIEPPPAGGFANITIEVPTIAVSANAERCLSLILLFLPKGISYCAPAAASGPIGLM